MLRIVKSDVCGVPVTGTPSIVVTTKGFVQVQMEPQYEDGEEFFERTADGTPCVNQKDAPTLKRMQLTVDLCEVDPIAAQVAAGFRLLDTVTPPVTGTGFTVAEGTPTAKFSMEVWQQVAGSGACDASGLQRYIYNAWPHVGNLQMGSYTIENGRSTLQFIAETFGASTLWGRGPSTTKWMPTGTHNNVTALDHWVWNITTTAPPTALCGSSTIT
jgi:hypothetical protein